MSLQVSNMRSVSEQPEVLNAYLTAELTACHLAGPFASPPWPCLHISPFGVIPKNHQPGKWCPILDLSSLHLGPVLTTSWTCPRSKGGSINDDIPEDPFSLHHVSVDDVVRALGALDLEAFMAKFDVRAAYRNVPIHPDDRFFAGHEVA